MPTALPRLAVTLTAEQRDVIAKVAAYNETSQSKVIAELVDAALPVLTRMLAAIETVKLLDAEKRSAIVATLADAQRDAEETAATALALLERIAAPRAEPTGDAQRPPPAPTVDLATARRKHVRGRNLPPSC